MGGILGGLFGSGSGLIILPAIIKFLRIDEYVARGTTLITVLFIVISSSFFYYKNNFFDIKLGIYTAIGGIIGGIIGAKLMKNIPKFWLSVIFELFVIVISIMMIFSN
ncbi:MAG: TSUP family transporter [Clostridia bacterium]|nr:TSUP family transporter [Clostridia bacterium]